MKSLKESQNEQNMAEHEDQALQNQDMQELSYCQDSYPDESQQTTQTCIFEIEPFLKKIQKDVEEKTPIFNASFGWTLMIYDFIGYNPDKLSELLDAEQTWKEIIKYNEAYSLVLEIGKCMNCLQTTTLLNNSCGHLCCHKCWESHLRKQYQVRVNIKLFPLCLKEQCNHNINYQIIAYLKQKVPALEKSYAFILISKYCLTNSSIKFCPNLSCGKIIDRSFCKDQNFKCSCGFQLCLNCGEQPHLPLECNDLETWNSLVLVEHEQKAIIKCFSCQAVFSLQGTSYIVKCICGQCLCWRCQKEWSNQCTFRRCDVKTFKVLIGASNIQNHQKPLSCDSYEEAKELFDKLSLSIERLKAYCLDDQKQELISMSVLQIDAQILDQMKIFILNAWQILRRCCIYIFFGRQHADDLKKMIDLISRAATRADNYLYGSLLKDYQAMNLRASNDPNYRKIFEKQKYWKQKQIKQEFLTEKKSFVHLINEGKQMIELVKKGKINEAYENANYFKTLSYLDIKRRYYLKSNDKC